MIHFFALRMSYWIQCFFCAVEHVESDIETALVLKGMCHKSISS